MEATTQAVEIVTPCDSKDCTEWNEDAPGCCEHSVRVSSPITKCFNYTPHIVFSALGEGK